MRTFAEVLRQGNIDIADEYNKLYILFYDEYTRGMSIAQIISKDFKHYQYRNTCLSLEEFNKQYGFQFSRFPEELLDVEYLMRFYEYVHNILYFYYGSDLERYGIDKGFLLNQIMRVVSAVDYVKSLDHDIPIFVPRDTCAIEVSKSGAIPAELSYKVLAYNHYSYKGNLAEKREVLQVFANILEARREELKQINNSLASTLFFSFNNFDIRHNNAENDGRSTFQTLSADKKEKAYDKVYRLCLLAFMELDYRPCIKELDALKV